MYGYELYGFGRSSNDKWAASDVLSEQLNQAGSESVAGTAG